MNNYNNKNMINKRTIEKMFGFKKADKDVCSVIAMFIGGDEDTKKKLDKIDYRSAFYYNIDKIVKCNCDDCDYENMNNHHNFKKFCCGCEAICCNECYDLNKYEICNEDDDEDNWLCYDCGADCEGCDRYVYNEDMRGLMDRSGDYIYRCIWCLNDNRDIKDIVFAFGDENYDKKDCYMGDCDDIECDDCDALDDKDNCIAGECDDDKCCGWERCDDCKKCECYDCKEEHYDGCKKCDDCSEWACKNCAEKILYCEGCNCNYNKCARDMYKLGDEDKYACADCINDNMRYM